MTSIRTGKALDHAMLNAAPVFAIAILIGPIFFGLAATFLPAFGYFPALGGVEPGLHAWHELFSQPGLLRSCAVSFASGLVTTFCALIVAFGFVAGWSQTRVFHYLQHLLSPLLSLPHAAAAFGLAFLFMPSGWIMRLLSPWLTGTMRPPDVLIIHDPYGISLIGGLFAKELPFLFLVILAAMPQAGVRQSVMVARNLGYGRIAAFAHGPWPAIYRQIRLAVFAVIAYASSVVDVALILGPTSPPPLAVRLVSWMQDPDLATRFMASAGAVLQLAISLLCLIVWIAGERLAGAIASHLQSGGLRFTEDHFVRVATAVLAAATVAAVFLGLVVLATWSVAGYWPFPNAIPASFTFANWSRAAAGIARPLTITLVLGVVVTICALVLAVGCLERETRAGPPAFRGALAVIYAPLIVPQISFVFGLQLLFLMTGMNTDFLGLALVHLTFVLPYVLLSLTNPWRAWDPRFGHVARTLGATANRIFWRIRLPMLLGAVLVACALGFAVSVGQYLPTVLIGGGRWPTVTTEAVALSSSGDRRVIGVYAFVQLALPFLGFGLALLIPALAYARRRDMRVHP